MATTRDTSAARTLAVLETLSMSDRRGGGLTAAALARAVGRDKSSVSRQLKSLIELGLVDRDEDGLHTLGWKLFAVAAQAGDQRLLVLAAPVMRKVAESLRERVHLSVRREAEVLTVASEGLHRSVEAVGWVGRAVPVSCTSSGRALLLDHSREEATVLLGHELTQGAEATAPRTASELNERIDRARQHGFAAVVGEFDEDLAGVAAPVRDARGRIVAAVNISAPSYRLSDDSLESAGEQVRRAASYLSRVLSSPAKTGG